MRRTARRLALGLALLVAQLLLGCTLGGRSATPTATPGATATPAGATATAGLAGTVGAAAPTATGALPASPTARQGGAPAPASPAAAGTPLVLTAPPRTGHPTPRGAQVLTIAGGQAPPTLDPALVRDVDSAFLAHQVFRGLVRLDNTLTPVPDLAERIAVSPDGLTYTFTLRAGAVFQDGRPITADAVKYSLERATDPALAGGHGDQLPGATYLNDIAGAPDKLAGRAHDLRGVRVVDAHTLTIALDAPKVYFLMKLSHPVASVVDQANVAGGARWWQHPNGSGPFRLDSFAADKLVLKRFDRFYGGAPTLETVNVLLGSAASEPMNLYEGGTIDYTQVPLSSVDRVLVASSPLHAELTVTPQLGLTYIGFNVTMPPYDDPSVRRAFLQALDRGKIARVSEEGKVVLAQGIVPPNMPGGPWTGTIPPYDLAAAKADLAASRYGGAPGLPRAQLYTADGGIAVTMEQVYKRDLGVPLEVIGVDWPQYLQGLSARSYPAFELSWVADYPDPENFLGVLFASDSGENQTGYRNPEVDRLLAEAAVERDPAKRHRLYLQIQQRILDDVVIIPIYHAIEYTVVKPYVKGLTITPMGILDLDTVWIER
ncbi:MAG TPA: peptide ABC transporter substrate-binding protein [Thermomicrobiales bacterium]|nr:peptide ABC transporter substrate-binding protein [Thermomicrobiales bacterium]